jgi:hypothetical protein
MYTEKGLPCEKISQKLDFGAYQEPLHNSQIQCIEYNINTILNWIK